MALLLLLLGGRARAEAALDRLDLSSWQEAVGESVDVKELARLLLRGDLEGGLSRLMQEARRTAEARARELAPALLALMAPVFLYALFRRLLAGRPTERAALTVCYLAEASALTGLLQGEIVAARQAVLRVGSLGEKMYPVLGAMLAAGGSGGSGALFQTAAGLLPTLLTPLYRAAFALCSAAAVLAVAGNMSKSVRLEGLFLLARSANNWLMGFAVTVFLGAMGVLGLMGSAHDGVAMRAAKYTVDNLLPVIGGEVKDTLDSVASGLLLARNAVGVTGALLLLLSCLAPIVRLALAILCVRLAAALTEPLNGDALARCLGQFGSALQMLLVALAACAAFFLVMVSAVLRTVNAIAMLG